MILRQHTVSYGQQQQCTEQQNCKMQQRQSATTTTTTTTTTTKKKVIYCDFKTTDAQQADNNRESRRRRSKDESCDQNLISTRLVISRLLPFLVLSVGVLLLATPPINKLTIVAAHQQQTNNNNNGSMPLSSTFAHIQTIDHHHHPNHARPRPATSGTASGATTAGHAHAAQHTLASPHLQPSYVYGLVAAARNSNSSRSTSQQQQQSPTMIFNFTHIAYDELTNSVYVGGTNWLFQLSGANLRPEHALKVGPSPPTKGRDCSSPTDSCQIGPIAHIDLASLPLRHAPGNSDPFGASLQQTRLRSSQQQQQQQQLQPGETVQLKQLVHNQAAAKSSQANSSSPSPSSSSQHNNYNKILAIDADARQLIVCGSLSQGGCRKHSLGQLSNYSDLIPLPVASNDESSSSVAFIPKNQQQQQQRLMYVAATNSRPDPYRDMVPAISGRHLEPAQKTMQIIESSFAEARVDISFELRDYYLVNYVYAFQHGEFVYFATVQRRSPLRQLEEWGYITRLARLCLNDLSFQSYTEMTLECVSSTHNSGKQTGQQQQQQQINYNLLQDATLISAGSDLVQQLRLTKSNQVLATVFAQSRDHSTRSQTKSAVCLFPMEMIEQRFNENIQQCYNGTSKSRNMNYIGGSVSDCPRPGSASLANVCSEPLKLNGSLALTSRPVLTYDDELLTAIAGFQAPTSPLSSSGQQQQHESNQSSSRQWKSQRSHQVLVLGTGSGLLKRVLVQSGSSATEFDSIQLLEPQASGEPVLADLHVTNGGDLIAGTGKRIVKLKVNGCKHISSRRTTNSSSSSSSWTANECDQCQQLQDPFCGWCSSSSTCSTRDECIRSQQQQQQQPNMAAIQWSPFDQIKCNDYRPIEPKFVPLQSDNRRELTAHATVDVNVRIASGQQQQQLQLAGSQLAQAQFICHFDYLKHANRSMTSPLPRVSGATTKATQARLNPHTGTISIACPLPSPAQRPLLSSSAIDQTRVRLSVRLSNGLSSNDQTAMVEQLIGLSPSSSSSAAAATTTTSARRDDNADTSSIQRELIMYDCSVHTSCRTCLSAGSQQPDDGSAATPKRAWSCAWCPLSNRCTFNASHSEFGCAASAIAGPASSSLSPTLYGGLYSTTPQSVNNGVNNLVRASHLAMSLDQAQASVFGISIERLAQCPLDPSSSGSSLAPLPSLGSGTTSIPAIVSSDTSLAAATTSSSSSNANNRDSEILIPNGARRSIQVQLDSNRMASLLAKGRVVGSRFECLVEIEGAKARLSGRFVEPNSFVCQENQFVYQEEVATLRAELSLIFPMPADVQTIETFAVILYKCRLFGINPPALISTVGGHHSSVAWRAHELLQSGGQQQQQLTKRSASSNGQTADCSLCLNIERKYQCAWCQNQCHHSDQCSAADLQAGSTCPPPRIDSIHPTSGPLEGGTLLTIEGSNLGSNEREIQDKITVGGEPCQLVMYSVSTRIVCKTSASLQWPQAATVFVGNRAGITSAYEKFHYKAVHLTDVNPRFGPVSGGTRLYLSGSNLNIGSRIQIFLDDIPCSIDANNLNEGHQHSSNQISCTTAPNLSASSMRITKLTLMIDNSTHYFPYPFTYQPDPIITSIEPAESFLAGGRLILVVGNHLASPQSTKLMVYHEHKHNIVNATSCTTKNDNLIYCLTPAISRDLLAAATASSSSSYAGNNQDDDETTAAAADGDSGNQDDYRSILSYQSGGLKLKMALIMDDVKSVRNLDEYYHHLPHYLTYYENPQLFQLQPSVIDFIEGQDLIIQGENLQMKQLERDMLIYIESQQYVCLIKSISANQVSCEPPKKFVPIKDEHGQIVDRPVLPIIALIGNNLIYNVGFMRYNSKLHYQQQPLVLGTSSSSGLYPAQFGNSNSQGNNNDFYQQQPTVSASGGLTSSPSSLAILVTFSIIGFIVAMVATLMFALSRFRQSKAEREYKRIQLQIGLLDINGQPTLNGGGGLIFDKRLNYTTNATPTPNNKQSSFPAHKRALDYIGNLSSKKLLQQLTSGHHTHQVPSFPSSSLTDISSLAGGNHLLNNSFNNHLSHHQQQQQHIIKLSNNGTISNSTYSGANHIYSSANPSSLSSQSSPGSTRDQQQQPLVGHQHQQFIDGHHPAHTVGNNNNLITVRDQQNGFQSQLMKSNDKSQSFLLTNGGAVATTVGGGGGNSRNFNWTQDAPSTIVPYAVIEACNLTLDGKNQPMKEFV